MLDLHDKYILVRTEKSSTAFNPVSNGKELLKGTVSSIGRGLILQQTGGGINIESVPESLREIVKTSIEEKNGARPTTEIGNKILFYKHLSALNPLDSSKTEYIISVDAIVATITE